jgi:hypothetical protein
VERRTQLHRSTRSSTLDVDPDSAWRVVAGAGPGEHWYVDAAPLAVRGLLDRLVGGRGRRWPVPDRPRLEKGDTAGFWRVRRAAARKRILSLEADVVSPGTVRLEVLVRALDDGGSVVTTSVRFEPGGLLGQLYMLVDLPARETVVELVHRRLLSEIRDA